MKRLFWVIGAVLLLTVQGIAAQTDCAAILQQALDSVGNSCDSFSTNSACYGHWTVDASFMEEIADTSAFDEPAEVVNLAQFSTLETQPLNFDDGTWGIAVMKVLANLPAILPGEAVTFLMLGGVEIENRVDMTVRQSFTIRADSMVRQQPAFNSPIIEIIGAGTVIEVDSVTTSGEWVRIASRGWISTESLESTEGLETLPVNAPEGQTPMQAFYLTTSIGEVGCAEAPDVLTIRSPENIVVDLNINGLNVRIASIVTARNIDENEMALTVLEGGMEIPARRLNVPAGHTVTAILDNSDTVISLGEPRPATEQELEIGRRAADVLRVVDDLPEVTEPMDQQISNDPPPQEVVHIVVRGDTLNSIARQYDASAPAIVERNGIANPNLLYVGQALTIPNPGSGYVGLSGDGGGGGNDGLMTQEPPSENVDCTRFRATAPLDGLRFGQNTFYWDPAPGADSYIVTVTNLDARRSTSFTVPATQTSVTGDLDQTNVGFGFSFQWSVAAVAQGQVACTSGPFVMQRGALGDPFIASWVCSTGGALATFSGLRPDLTVRFTYTLLDGTRRTSQPLQGPAGSILLPFEGNPGLWFGVAVPSEGPSVALSPDDLNC